MSSPKKIKNPIETGVLDTWWLRGETNGNEIYRRPILNYWDFMRLAYIFQIPLYIKYIDLWHLFGTISRIL